MKKRLCKMLAGLLAACFVLAQGAPSVYAQEEVRVPHTEVIESTLSTENKSLCNCVTPCTAESVNESCLACGGLGWENCEPKPVDPPTCICDSACTVDAVNELCLRCGGLGWESCEPKPVDPPTCICDSACTVDAVNELCLRCGGLGWESCEPKPVDPPTCICENLCAAGYENPECSLCSLQGAANCKSKNVICICETICPKGNENPACVVCDAWGWGFCDANPPDPVDCICDSPCTEDAANPDCPVCKIFWTACQRVCTCLAQCSPDFVDMDCSICSQGEIDQCVGAPCKCEYKCDGEKGLINPFCAVCLMQSHEFCTGSKPRICNCTYDCDPLEPSKVNSLCPVCSINKTLCAVPECTCANDGFICTNREPNPNCEACTMNDRNCRYQCTCEGPFPCDQLLSSCSVCAIHPEDCRYQPTTFPELKTMIETGTAIAYGFQKTVPMEGTIVIDRSITLFTFPEVLNSTGTVDIARTVQQRNAPLFRITSGGSLIIHDLVLSGNSDYLSSTAPLVEVEQGGTLILGKNAVLTANENNKGDGGGVSISGGTLIMESSSAIRGNQAFQGAGVYLTEGGRIELRDSAKITGNSASSQGGGVYCANGKLSVSGAVQIFSNTAGAATSNLVLDAKASPITLGMLGVNAKIGISSRLEGHFAEKEQPLENVDVSAFKSDEGLYVTADKTKLFVLAQPLDLPSGRILIDKNSVQNATVTILDRASGAQLAQCATDQFGVYKVPLANTSSPLRLLVSVRLNGESYGAVADLSPLSRANETFPDLPLEKGRVVSGSFVNGVEGTQVQLFDMFGKLVATDQLYSDGLFDVLLSSVGSYPVTASNAEVSGSGWITLSPEGNIVGTQMTMSAGRLLTGQILMADGSPAAGATITFSPRKKGRSIPLPPSTAITNAQGDYTVSGMREGVNYDLTAFSTDNDQAITVQNVIVQGTNITLPTGESNKVQLQSASSVTGSAAYFKSLIDDKIKEPPHVTVELRTSNGVKIAEAPVRGDGTFTLSPVWAGQYRVAVISNGDDSVRIDSVEPVFRVFKDGSFFVESGSNSFAPFNGTDGPMANTLWIHNTMALSNLWMQIIQLTRTSLGELDLSPNGAHSKLFYTVYDFYKSCSPIERDMLPSELFEKFQEIFKYMENHYKVSMDYVISSGATVSSVSSDLGKGLGVSPAAKRIAAVVALKYGLDSALVNPQSEINLSLRIAEPSQDGKRAIDQALLGGETLAYFDITLDANFQAHRETYSGAERNIEFIHEPGETIQVNIALKEHPSKPGDYVVIRVHAEEDGRQRIDLIQDVAYENGIFSFHTDCFSTYAIAYARPNEGIVLELSPDASNSGSSSNYSNTASGSLDGQYEFWLNIRSQIKRASAGSVIVVNAKNYNLLPSMVMEVLAGQDVTLIIKRTGKDPLVLYGMDLIAKKNTPYYEFQGLEDLSEEPANMEQVLEEFEPSFSSGGSPIPLPATTDATVDPSPTTVSPKQTELLRKEPVSRSQIATGEMGTDPIGVEGIREMRQFSSQSDSHALVFLAIILSGGFLFAVLLIQRRGKNR